MKSSQLLHAAIVSLAVVSLGRAQNDLPAGGQPTQPAAAPAAEAEAPTYRQQVSYVLGRNFGGDLLSNEVECDLQYLMAGISDALSGAEPRWSDDELAAAMQRFQQEMQQRMTDRFQRVAAQNQQQADTFLAQNLQRDGVQQTASGLQYIVVRQGKGASPTLQDNIRCHYRGVLLDGTVFDSSYDRGEPAELSVDGVIPGWTEALQKMRVGDRWQLFVPPNLAYGENPHPASGIEPNSLLIFEIELLDVLGQ